MPRFNQKGLTLVEVLVCLIILSTGAVYVVFALARSAETERRLADRYPVYPVLASQMAEIDMRVSTQKDPLKTRRGKFTADTRSYDWSVENRFENPADEAAFKERTLSSALVRNTLSAGWNSGQGRETVAVETFSRYVAPEKDMAL